jgi:alginate O-acetyltransferase complex protein AlgI
MSLFVWWVLVAVVVAFLLSLAAGDPWRRPLLATVSAGLYAWIAPLGAIVTLALAVLTWTAARDPRRPPGQLRILAAVVFSIGVLLTFKLLEANRAAGGAPFVVPLGISYVTLKLVSYVLDVAWDRIEPEPSLASFLLYAFFFPQLPAGPIQRARDFLPQVSRPFHTTPTMATQGLRMILFGLFQKAVVADRLGPLVNPIYDSTGLHAQADYLVAFWAFPFQLYADFSALTDLARGTALLFGIHSPPNFRLPFYAPSLQEFWRRWHMTLTGWLADYLFTPLLIALRGLRSLGLALAIAASMVAVGLWHGLSLPFLVFGLMNGLLLAAAALRPRRTPRASRWSRAAGALLTFHLVALSFVFFRAESLQGAGWVLAGLLRFGTQPVGWRPRGGARAAFVTAACVALMEAIHLGRLSVRANRVFSGLPLPLRWAAYYALLLSIAVLGDWGQRSFIYTRF